MNRTVHTRFASFAQTHFLRMLILLATLLLGSVAAMAQSTAFSYQGRLNDGANDVERQHLIRFVTRLACADTPEIERERAAYIQSRTARYYTFFEGLQILEEVLVIGRQADAFAPDKVRTRMQTVQQSAADNSIADSPRGPVPSMGAGWLKYRVVSRPPLNQLSM